MAVMKSSPGLLHEDRLHYTPVPGSVRLARRRAARLVGEWGYPAVAGDVALVVSELASNALLHGSLPDRLFRVHLTATAAALRVEVTDPRGERMPQVKSPTAEDKFGRGLLLIDHLASRWGITPLAIGKTVWAEIDLPVAPSPPAE
jgi:hypothetical protein